VLGQEREHAPRRDQRPAGRPHIRTGCGGVGDGDLAGDWSLAGLYQRSAMLTGPVSVNSDR
jgi:hypothetical protein